MIAGIGNEKVAAGRNRNTPWSVETGLKGQSVVSAEPGHSIPCHRLNHSRDTVNPADSMVELVSDVNVAQQGGNAPGGIQGGQEGSTSVS